MRQFRLLLVGLLVAMISPAQSQSSEVHPTISEMTLEQKVGQMFAMTFFGSELNLAARDLLTTWQPGIVILLPSNIENPQQITRLNNDIQSSLVAAGGIPAFIATDQEGGIVAHLEEGFTRWPVPTLLTATQNETLAQAFGEAVAEEMLAVGINMNLAPVADLYTNLDNPVIGRRSFGYDLEMATPMITAMIRGMQSQGVMATTKHFPGHGETAVDSHLELPVLDLTVDELSQRELQPFRSAIEAGTGAVMVAHIHFPQIDPQSEIPASLSENVIQGLLRDEMGYDGVVITDALDMDAIDTVYSPSDAAIAAIEAGNDVVLLGAHVGPDTLSEAMQAVVDAVRDRRIPQARIDESVNRILHAKEDFNVFSWAELEPSQAELRINIGEHTQLVEDFFREGITLVHDDGEQLPIAGSTLMVYAADRATLGLACNRNGWQFIQVSRNPTDEEIGRVVDASRYVDNVVIFTETARAYTQQIELVEQLPLAKTIVVAFWSPFDALVLPDVATYFVSYSPLPQAYVPMCDILHGEAEPRGTLSVMLEGQ